jgi:hypothetical protein
MIPGKRPTWPAANHGGAPDHDAVVERETIMFRKSYFAMRRGCVILIVSLLGGCFPVGIQRIYLPEDVTSTSLTTHFRARLFEKEGVGLYFAIDAGTSSPFQGSLWFDIPQLKSGAFLEYRVTIEDPSSSTSFTAEIYRCQQPLHRLEHYCFRGAPRIADQEVIVVTLPPIEINGSRYHLKPIRFSPKRKLVVYWPSA